jgi:hypothetical protein
MTAGTEIELYGAGLPEQAASWTYDDYVAAWHEVESRSAWFRADLALAVVTNCGGEGILQNYAWELGVSYGTMRNYRYVASRWPLSLRSDISFAAAKALAPLDDRFELTARKRKPWTEAEARKLAASRKPPKPRQERKARKPSPGGQDGGRRESGSGTAATTAATTTTAGTAQHEADATAGLPPARLRAARRPGPGLRPPRGLLGPSLVITEIPGGLPEELERLREEAREETRRAVAHELRAKFEDLWNALAAERDALAEERDRLQAEVERLSGRVGTCPEHRKTALVLVCPACQGLEE